jgi:uncharacterized protein YraI
MNKHYWLLAALCGATAASLFADEPATINRARVNVRGGPSFASEVITQLQKGDQVTFIEEVAVEKPKPGEPSKWAAIKLPANTAVWVFTDFLNDKTVKVPRLNLRAGPGENYSVVGRLQRGDTVKQIRVVEGWMQIETPETARAYVDASYLTRAAKPEPVKVYEPPAKTETTVASKPVETPKPEPAKAEPVKTEAPKPTPTVVKEEPPVVVTPPKEEEKKPITILETPKPAEPTPAATTPTATTPAATTPTPTPTPTPVQEKPPEVTRVLPQVAPPIQMRTNTVTVKRVVRREGELRSTKFNIQAPTYFELVNVDSGKIINYLSGDKAGLKLKDYKGLRVIVTGEEYIEPRYPDRPLLEIETIEVAP